MRELRGAGAKKLAIIVLLAAIAVALAYGNNSTNDAASGRTLPAVHTRSLPAGGVVTAGR